MLVLDPLGVDRIYLPVVGSRLTNVALANLVSLGKELGGVLRNACDVYRIFT